MTMIQTRRQLLTGLSAAGAVGLLGGRPLRADEAPPEVTTVRLVGDASICQAPGFIADDLLRAEGSFTVVGRSADTARAVQLAEQQKPDLVILDLTMPLMNGIEATRRIRTLLPSTRLLVLSAQTAPTYVGSALKAKAPHVKVLGAEPETAAPLSSSLAADAPQEFHAWEHSFVDGAGGRSVIQRMWERMKPVVDGDIVVTLDETRRAMRMMAEKARVVSEGAGALPLAAALTGKAGDGPIACVVSGGNVDLKWAATKLAR